ncbi:MAG: hypothetical protein JKP95_00705 [Oceanicaulis sp.]|nr:hypothetical protein [Oceanicaulis sp.]
MDELKLTKAHAMKVDVEGGEAAILSHFFAKAPKTRWPDLLILERADMADGRHARRCSTGAEQGLSHPPEHPNERHPGPGRTLTPPSPFSPEDN